MNNIEFFSQYSPYYSKILWYETPTVYDHLRMLFENANRKLIKQDADLFRRNSSEISICGALMQKLKSSLWGTPFSHYYIDIEYNRNFNYPKLIYSNGKKRKITCDLIVHSRGQNINQDNLISVEMKKSDIDKEKKERDRDRLMVLTSPSFDGIWRFDGTELPPYVCRYILGVYYEIRDNNILLEYYRHGTLQYTDEIPWQ